MPDIFIKSCLGNNQHIFSKIWLNYSLPEDEGSIAGLTPSKFCSRETAVLFEGPLEFVWGFLKIARN